MKGTENQDRKTAPTHPDLHKTQPISSLTLEKNGCYTGAVNHNTEPTPEPETTRIKLNTSYFRHYRPVPFSEDVIPSSLFLRNSHYLIFDIETQQLAEEVGGWAHIDRLKISVACAYDSKTDEYLTFRESELPKLFELMKKRLVIGYNSRGFDLVVCAAYGLPVHELDSFDMMVDIEAGTRLRFIKLESIAQGTLGVGKSAEGVKAVEWYKSGQIDKIIEYCLQDVKVTKEIFEHGRQKGFIKIQHSSENIRNVPVQWT